MTCGNYVNFKFQRSQNEDYWNIATFIPLCVFYTCFLSVTGELSTC